MNVPAGTTSILVPTWRRPQELTRCLTAISRQSRRPREVVVVVRFDDAPTLSVIGPVVETLEAAGVPLTIVRIEPAPLTAAMNAGLEQTGGDLVALTDDDAEPLPEWLERLEAPFADPAVGGVGGRDRVAGEGGAAAVVGKISALGRVRGNHHLGSGPARDVELLKGVNCAFRGDELRRIGFDRRLRGRGNVSHWEMSLCFAFRRAGWRLVYDPAIAVDHHVAQRHDGDTNARGQLEPRSHADGVYNETLSLLEYLSPARRAAFIAWAAVVGTGDSPGLAMVPKLIAEGQSHVGARWRATIAGRMAAILTYTRV